MDMDKLWRSAKDAELEQAAERFSALNRDAQIAVRNEIQRRGLNIETVGEVHDATIPAVGWDKYGVARRCTYPCIASYLMLVALAFVTAVDSSTGKYWTLMFVIVMCVIVLHVVLGPVAIVCALLSRQRLSAWWIYLYFSLGLPLSFGVLGAPGWPDKLLNPGILFWFPIVVAALLIRAHMRRRKSGEGERE